MKPALSIIVPVYNVEKYLARCLDSLIRQTLKEIEIIVVDDGSTDDSGAIAQEYAKRDNRIILIRQKNQGLSGARNTGLSRATGRYIGFVDSDDWVDTEMFAKMYEKAIRHRADICACDYALAYPDRNQPQVLALRESEWNIQEYGLDRLWNGQRYSVVVWNKIYRAEIVERHGLRFESNRNVFSEDVLFNLYFLRHASVFASIEGSFYYYFQRENSLMSSRKPDYLKRELRLVDLFSAYYADYSDRRVYERMVSRLFFERVQNGCLHNLEGGATLGETTRELAEAGAHREFGKHMKAAGKDSGIWKPMRVFARLCGWRCYFAAVCWIRTVTGMSFAAKQLRARKKEKGGRVFVPTRTL